MNRLLTLVGSTIVVGLVGGIPGAMAQPDGSRSAGNEPVRRVANVSSGTIDGVVVDERGTPLAGAMVSALGSVDALAVTDRRGTFVLRALPPGAYVVRAHLAGFAPSRRQFVDVRSSARATFTVTLQRTANTAFTTSASPPPPRLLAAGLGPELAADPLLLDPLTATDGSSAAVDDRSEKAWRLRHLPRSVLKDVTERASAEPLRAGDLDPSDAGTVAFIARAVGASARFFSDLPLTGQLNLMTSGSFDDLSATLSSDNAVRSTAYLRIGGPAWQYGDWSARLLTQGDLGAWFLAATFRSHAPARNVYDIGFSYSAFRLATTTSRWPVFRTDVGGRSAGAIYGVGRFVVSRRLSFDYGGRYSRYDYLAGSGLLSPSVMVTVVPLNRFRVHTGMSRRMLAPGAEQFLEPLAAGVWAPPTQTFVGTAPLVAERTQHYEVGVEHDLTRRFVVAFRTFYQDTADQQVAWFGAAPGGGASRHYALGNGGDVVTTGWSIGVTHNLFTRLRGSVAYQMTSARWAPGALLDQDGGAGGGLRLPGERLHDVTTSVETEIPLTATHVYAAYKINSGYARREADSVRPGFDGRFDVQVSQRLPFLNFTSAEWQVLVAVRNLFRDAARDGSVYDELLVIRPPTRIVGGLVVRF